MCIFARFLSITNEAILKVANEISTLNCAVIVYFLRVIYAVIGHNVEYPTTDNSHDRATNSDKQMLCIQYFYLQQK